MRCWPSCAAAPTTARPGPAADRASTWPASSWWRRMSRPGWACASNASGCPRCRRKAATSRPGAGSGGANAGCCRWRSTSMRTTARRRVFGRQRGRAGAAARPAARTGLRRDAGRACARRRRPRGSSRDRDRAAQRHRAGAGLDRPARRSRATALAARLASQFNFNLPQIASMARSAALRGRRTASRRRRGALGPPAASDAAREAGPARAAHPAQGRLGRHRAAARERWRCCTRSPPRSRQRRRVYEDWGFARSDEPRPGHQRAVRRRERHRQDDGGRGARQRAARSTSTASTCRPW